MHEREWHFTENLIIRIGLFVAASYALYVGVVQWGLAADARHPTLVVLELLTYAAAFAMLFAAASGVAIRIARHLIPVVFIFALLVQAYLRLETQPLAYGTDSAAYTQYAAELYLQGQNPYGRDLTASLERFRMPPTLRTANIDGSYEDVLPYPALSFLIYVPFIAAGLGDLRVVLLIFHILVLILLYVAAPRWVKPFVLLPFFISPDIVAYTLGTVTDVTWVFFITAAALLWNRRDASALLFGIAASIKQHPWVLLPFLLLRLWQESEGLSLAARVNVLARYFGIAEIVFLAANGPFILSSPTTWAAGVLAPPLGPLVVDGEGLSVLSQVGLLYAPRAFYSLATFVVAVALFVIYWAHFKRLSNVVWLFPALILWFPYRSLQSYFIYWIPPLLVSLYESLRVSRASRTPRPAGQAHSAARRSSAMARRASTVAVAAVMAFVGGGILFYLVSGTPTLQVTVDRALVNPDNNLIQQLNVSVTNIGSKTIHPVFWVKQTGHPRFHWEIASGPTLLPPGMQAHFAITAAFPEYQVPNASTVAVVVNDSEDADTASFSNPLAVDLLAHASLINPDFFYWSKAGAGKVEQPYAWGFFQIGQTPTRNAEIEDSQAASKPCLAMRATQTVAAPQDGWLGGFLDQWIEFPNDKLRVPVWPTFRYAGGDTPETVMGIEVRDDTHRLWYIFSNEPERIWIDPANPVQAFHLLEAPLNRWSEHTIDLSADYNSLGWPLPASVIIQKDGRPILQRMVNFRLFVASQNPEPFSYQGCFGPIIQHLP